MDIRIKNNDSSNRNWGGKEFTPGEVYTLQAADYIPFTTDVNLFAAVGNATALVGTVDGFFSDSIRGWAFLAHDGNNEVTLATLPEPQPFALPTYRTKRSATSSYIEIAAGSTVSIDYLLTAERYVSGGMLIAENSEFGDYVTAEVRDVNGVIPAPYRAAICESHPTVATYIEKEFVKVGTPGSIQAGSVSSHTIDTYPLNAKITPGLYLRLTYTAVNSGSTRRVVVNYHLTKKL